MIRRCQAYLGPTGNCFSTHIDVGPVSRFITVEAMQSAEPLPVQTCSEDYRELFER